MTDSALQFDCPTKPRWVTSLDLTALSLRMMLGAGIFVGLGAAFELTGVWILLSWVIAGAAAACCAVSAARLNSQLAGRHPNPRPHQHQLHPIADSAWLNRFSSWAGICAKTAAVSVLILTIYEYIFFDVGVWLAGIIAVAFLTIHTVRDRRSKALTRLLAPPRITSSDNPQSATAPPRQDPPNPVILTRVLVVFVLVFLGFIALVALSSRQADLDNISDHADFSWGIVSAAAILFFTFGSYSDTLRTNSPTVTATTSLPITVRWAIAIAIVVLAATGVVLSLGLLLSSPAPLLGQSDSILLAAADRGGFNRLEPFIRLLVIVACRGVAVPLLRSLQQDLTAQSVFPVSAALAPHQHHDQNPAAETSSARSPRSTIALVAGAGAIIALTLLVEIRPLLTFAAACLLLLGLTQCLRAFFLPRQPRKPPQTETLENRILRSLQLRPKTPTKFQQRRLDKRLQRPHSRPQDMAETTVRIIAVVGVLGCLLLVAALPVVHLITAAGILFGGTAVLHFSAPDRRAG